MTFDPPPAWQLPDGVDPALWRYTHTPRLAVEEDEYFAGHPLFARDAALLDQRFAAPGRWSTSAPGPGGMRSGSPRGASTSRRSTCRGRCSKWSPPRPGAGVDRRLSCVQANLVPPGLSRRRVVRLRPVDVQHPRDDPRPPPAAARCSRPAGSSEPGGRLALHAHNVWLNLADPHGRRWLLGQVGRRLLGRTSFGDRTMTYRGVAGMEVHLYRWAELAVTCGPPASGSTR